MGFYSAYLVPQTPLEPGPSLEEGCHRLWQKGLTFMNLPEWGELPDWDYPDDFEFEYMGIAISEKVDDPVPSPLYDLRCPKCNASMAEVFAETWEELEDESLASHELRCAACGAMTRGDSLRSDTPYTFARVYFFVSDIDPDHWPKQLRHDVESVFGPCREYISWET
jgi:hypothetical protein